MLVSVHKGGAAGGASRAFALPTFNFRTNDCKHEGEYFADVRSNKRFW